MTQNAHYLEGPLSKWTNLVNGWQYRWFVLNYQTGILSYYTSREKMKRGSERGCIYLQRAMIGIDDEDDSGFSVTNDFKQFHFQARDTQDREKWIRALECAIFHQKQKVPTKSTGVCEGARYESTVSLNSKCASSGQKSNVTEMAHALQHFEEDRKHFETLPKRFDFDAKIAEADAYLQILINQLKNLEVKISATNQEDEMYKKYLEIKVSTNALIDSVKHSIVILQITRNALFPSTGIYQSTLPPLIIKTPPAQSSPAQSTPGTGPGNYSPVFPLTLEPLTPPSEVSSSNDSPPPVPGSKHHSFSSSDEDFFFDAVGEGKTISGGGGKGAPPTRLTPYFSPKASMASPSPPPAQLQDKIGKGNEIPLTIDLDAVAESPITQGNSDASASIDVVTASNKGNNDHCPSSEDLLFQDSSEEELEDVSNYGGIIKHLVSQVRIGMDLTKVTLPTFILERRSLLEMFADFFAHAQLFSNVTDQPSPKDRMTEIVRYYLSSFHTGRKSAVAKKPFNPILGEVFKCHWEPFSSRPKKSDPMNIGEEHGPPNEKDQVLVGSPVQEAGADHLTFVAEQVSHHPPISAFYAENVAKRVCLNANIWTKSKFLGLSIGVHMIGQGVINLLEHGEEYVCTFPNAYARSIFSIPWIEMGGKVTITCSKTGYFSNIEFLTKPFYGGSKNQVSAQLFSPYEKSPYLTVTGEWNGVMSARTSTDETFEFLDTKTIPTQNKHVKPIAQQEDYESRRIWNDVAKSLKAKELEQATEFKHAIEERQREEAKNRVEKGLKWECKTI